MTRDVMDEEENEDTLESADDNGVAQAAEVEDAVIIETPPRQAAASSSEVFRVSRDSVNYFLIAAMFLGLGVFLGINLGGDGVDSTKLRVIVQDVVSETYADQLEDLEEVLLTVASSNTDGSGTAMDQEALTALIQAAVEDAVAAQVDYLDDDDPFVGPEDAPIVMVEFSDFLCGFCGRHYQNTLTPLLENYGEYVRYVYRDFPGVGGQNAIVSALAAECANDQGVFWDYHNVLFENQQALGVQDQTLLEQVLIGFADDLELDTDTFSECLQTQEHYADVIRDLQDAQANGARGTPAFFINGQFISGAQPYEVFASIIEAELEDAGIEYEPEA